MVAHVQLSCPRRRISLDDAPTSTSNGPWQHCGAQACCATSQIARSWAPQHTSKGGRDREMTMAAQARGGRRVASASLEKVCCPPGTRNA